tara:strand:- start:630 stop:1283 length:654 start_codon:yes stop_codon:yes gene_type:complete
MTETPQLGWPGRVSALALVFLGGFTVMVLEVYGAYLMRPHFGSSQEVWLAMIGMVMVALSAGYYLGGRLADRFQRASFLTWLLYPAGVFIFFTEQIAAPVLELEWMVTANVVLASTLVSTAVFLPPCFVLGMLAPYMIRLCARHLDHVGAVAGRVYAASTMGSIAGVFVPVLLIPQTGNTNVPRLSIEQIFHLAGGLTIGLGVLCWVMDRWMEPDEA